MFAVAAVAIAVFGLGADSAFAQNEQFIPRLVYRTGPYAPNGIPFADGYADYLDMINARDGGVGGVKITYEECETGYNNDKGVECYERLKNKGPTGASLVDPLSTGITYALIERATADKIPVVSMGYGRADASYGAVFPYVFTLPATYWAQADAMVKYVGQQEGGLDKLKGKKIGLVYIDIAYGKEPIATLEKLSQKYGLHLPQIPGLGARHRAIGNLAASPSAAARLAVHVGLGGHELDRDQGSGFDRLSDGPLHRRVVVGLRARRRASRRGGGRATNPAPSTAPARTMP